MQDLHGDALNKIVGDMDDMESKRMFPTTSEGATITISVAPGSGASEEAPPMEGEPDHTLEMCKGGCAYHKGGMVPEPGETDDISLPPFLRKKKKVM